MKIKTQLTLAALMVMGMFATGCSQQSADASPAQQTTGQQTSQQATAETGTATETTTTETTTIAPTIKEVIKYDCTKCGDSSMAPSRPMTRPTMRPRPQVQRPSVRPSRPAVRPSRPAVRPMVRPQPMPQPMPEVVVPQVKAKGNYKGAVMMPKSTYDALMNMQNQ